MQALQRLDTARVEAAVDELDPGSAADRISRQLALLIGGAIDAADDEERTEEAVEIADAIAGALIETGTDEDVLLEIPVRPARVLCAIYTPNPDVSAKLVEAPLAPARYPDRFLLSPIEIEPRPFQEALLEQLDLAREQGHHRNLLVAATGTGKTVIAAVDYARLGPSFHALGSFTRVAPEPRSSRRSAPAGPQSFRSGVRECAGTKPREPTSSPSPSTRATATSRRRPDIGTTQSARR